MGKIKTANLSIERTPEGAVKLPANSPHKIPVSPVESHRTINSSTINSAVPAKKTSRPGGCGCGRKKK